MLILLDSWIDRDHRLFAEASCLSGILVLVAAEKPRQTPRQEVLCEVVYSEEIGGMLD